MKKILDNRVKKFAEGKNVFNKDQHWGRNGRGISTAIALAYDAIAHSQQDREKCNVIMRDVSKTFDKVWHNGLKFKIFQLNVPENFQAVLCHFLDHRTSQIKIG